MSEFVFYDPAVEPGTTRERPDGQVVRFVAAEEYYPLQLGHVSNATIVFLNIAPSGTAQLSEEASRAVDDAIANAYWNHYNGLLLPPRVMRTLARAAADGDRKAFLSDLEAIRMDILSPDVSLEDADVRRIRARVRALERGSSDVITDFQTACEEAFADLMYLQRAAMDDILRAESEREEGQTRADLLDKWDQDAALAFENSLPTIIRSAPVEQAIPSELRSAIQMFADRRRPYFKEGLFKG